MKPQKLKYLTLTSLILWVLQSQASDISPVTSGNFNSAGTWDSGIPTASDNVVIDGGQPASITLTLTQDQSIADLLIDQAYPGNTDSLTFAVDDPANSWTLTLNAITADTYSHTPLTLIVESGVTLVVNGVSSLQAESIVVKDGGSIIFNNTLGLDGQNATLIVEAGGEVTVNGLLEGTSDNSNYLEIYGTLTVTNLGASSSAGNLAFNIYAGGTLQVTNDVTLNYATFTVEEGGSFLVDGDFSMNSYYGTLDLDGVMEVDGELYVNGGVAITGDGQVTAGTYDGWGTIFGVTARDLADGSTHESAYYAIKSGSWTDGSVWSRSRNGSAAWSYPTATYKTYIPDGYRVDVDSDDQACADLYVESGGRLSLTASGFTVQGSLTLEEDAVCRMDDDLTVQANISLDGTLLANASDLTLSNGGTFSGSGAFLADFMTDAHITLEDSTTFTGSNMYLINPSSTVLELAPGVALLNQGTLTIIGNIAKTGSGEEPQWINDSAASLTIEGTIFTAGTGILTANATGNTIAYHNTAATTVKTPGDNTFYHLSLTGATTYTLDANLSINGNLQISEATLNSNDYALTLQGNWTNTGSFTGNGLVTFSGGNSQTLSSRGGESFYKLTLAKTAGTTLSISDNITISDTLTFTSGLILATSDTVTLGTSTAHVGSLNYTDGWVVGYISRWVAKAFHEDTPILFPVGSYQTFNPDTETTANYYRPGVVTPNWDSETGDGRISGVFMEAEPGRDGFDQGSAPNTYLNDNGTAVYNTFVDGYWAIENSGVNLTDYSLAFTASGFFGGTISSSTRLLSRVDGISDWLNPGTHVSATGSTVKRSGVTGAYAQFCCGSTVSCPNPAELIISGNDAVCTDAVEAYSVTETTGSSYVWNIPGGGGTITAGQGTHAVTVIWGSAGQEDQLTVRELTSCPVYGELYFLDVAIHSIQPVAIEGSMHVAAGQTGVIYAVEDFTDYDFTWGITGGTITANNNDQITVSWDNTAGYGELSVYAEESTLACGVSAAIDTTVERHLAINSVQNGLWSDAATWDCNCVPTGMNTVQIMHDVTTGDSAWSVAFLVIDAPGSLELDMNASKAFTVGNDLFIDGTLSGTGQLTLSGIDANISGNGTLNTGNTISFTNGDKTILANSALTITGDLSIANDIALSHKGQLSLNGDLLGGNSGSTWTNEAHASLEITGDLLSTGTLNASATDNTIAYHTTTATTLKEPVSQSYYHLTLTESGTKNSLFDLLVLGDLSNSSTLDCNNNNISVGGDWTNSGTFVEGTGTLTLNGSGSQALAYADTFYNLVVNNSSDSLLSLSDDITVTNAFTLSAGTLQLATGKLLSLQADNFSYSSGRIIGAFERTFTGASGAQDVFPLGTLTSDNPLRFTFNGTETGVIRAEFSPGDPGGNVSGLTEDGLNITGYMSYGAWTYSLDFTPSGSYDLEAGASGFYQAGTDSVISATRLLSRFSGDTDWTLHGSHSAASDPLCYRTGMSLGADTLELALGKTDCETFAQASISGDDNVCKGSSESYSIPDRGNSYVWTVSLGQADPEPASGQGTPAISINWQDSASIVASVSVVESNTCYTAPAVTLPVWIHALPTEDLTGPATVLSNSDNWIYSLSERTDYTYTWLVEPIVDGSSATVTDGDGTASAQLSFGDEGTYQITVIGNHNSCTSAHADSASYEVVVEAAYETNGTGGGNWENTATWKDALIPGTGDNARVLGNDSVIINSKASIASLFIEANGKLTQNDTLTINGNYKNNGSHQAYTHPLYFPPPTTSYTISGYQGELYAGAVTINNSIEILSGTELTVHSTGGLTLASGVSINNAGSISIDGDLAASGANAEWVNAENATLNISGGLFASGVGTLVASANGNTINYNGETDQLVIQPQNQLYAKLSLQSTASTTKTLEGATTVAGDLLIAGAAVLDVSTSNRALSVKGNWTDQHATAGFNARQGTVYLHGTDSQTVQASAGESFYNLVLGMTTGLSTTLQSDITITKELRLTSGTLLTGSYKVIIEDDATTNGGDADSFVDGTVQKNGDDDFIFPLGNNDRWARLGIAFATPATSQFVASYAVGVPDDTTSITGLNNVSTRESWDLSRLSGNDVYLTLYFEDTAWSYINDTADLTLAHYTGGTWLEEAATASLSGSGGTLTTDDVLSAYSPFTFGSKSAAVNLLPITLIDFDARQSGASVALWWTTASETNNDYFTLERSADGELFSSIATIAGAGNSSAHVSYGHTDDSPLGGTSYYRLKQTDYDGSTETSKVISVFYTDPLEGQQAMLTVYPNPYADGELTIDTRMFAVGALLQLRIYDLKDQLCYESGYENPEEQRLVLLPNELSKLTNGVYMLSVHAGTRVYTARLVKH